jgi:hypothetical protein
MGIRPCRAFEAGRLSPTAIILPIRVCPFRHRTGAAEGMNRLGRLRRFSVPLLLKHRIPSSRNETTCAQSIPSKPCGPCTSRRRPVRPSPGLVRLGRFRPDDELLAILGLGLCRIRQRRTCAIRRISRHSANLSRHNPAFGIMLEVVASTPAFPDAEAYPVAPAPSHPYCWRSTFGGAWSLATWWPKRARYASPYNSPLCTHRVIVSNSRIIPSGAISWSAGCAAKAPGGAYPRSLA